MSVQKFLWVLKFSQAGVGMQKFIIASSVEFFYHTKVYLNLPLLEAFLRKIPNFQWYFIFCVGVFITLKSSLNFVITGEAFLRKSYKFYWNLVCLCLLIIGGISLIQNSFVTLPPYIHTQPQKWKTECMGGRESFVSFFKNIY